MDAVVFGILNMVACLNLDKLPVKRREGAAKRFRPHALNVLAHCGKDHRVATLLGSCSAAIQLGNAKLYRSSLYTLEDLLQRGVVGITNS
jgi:hypothetical protein